jgi:hypothetical protein
MSTTSPTAGLYGMEERGRKLKERDWRYSLHTRLEGKFQIAAEPRQMLIGFK